MAYDGTPELFTKRLGNEIARLRTTRNWPRAKLIARLYNELDSTDPIYGRLSETWLARLESGRTVRVDYTVVEALCNALACTERERARVLLFSGRSVLVKQDTAPNTAAEVLNYAMFHVYHEASEILADVIGDRQAVDLGDQEIMELVLSALELVIHQRRA